MALSGLRRDQGGLLVKIAAISGRAVLVAGESVLDVALASDGRFGPDPMDVFEQWPEFVQWAQGAPAAGEPLDAARLGCPVPRPRQVFAIGLNYRSHAEESGMPIPSVPATFTKFPACLSGPYDEIELSGPGVDGTSVDWPSVDWEVELVVVIGRHADRVSESDAWDYVAGLTVGQDISDRTLQFAAGMQFSLGKSRRGFGPMGPWVVTPDEFADRDSLQLGCSVDGEVVQNGNTSDLVFSVAQLIAELSAVLSLYPGDVIFTGTPAGVGMARQPPRALAPGQVLETWVEGIGRLRNVCR